MIFWPQKNIPEKNNKHQEISGMTTKKIIPNILYLFHKGSFFELLDDYMITYILFFILDHS